MLRCPGYACVAIWLCRTCTVVADLGERFGCREEWSLSSQCTADHKSSLLQMRQFAPQSMDSALVEDSDAVSMPPAFEAVEEQTKGLDNTDAQDSATMPLESGETQGLKTVDLEGSAPTAAQTSVGNGQGSGDHTVALGHCHPQCMWKCDSPKCDEICKPICKPPRCETRCSGISLKGCAMDCNQPHCAVLCPERMCAAKSGQCNACTTTCSDAMCKLRCSNRQPCKNVCEHPKCEWSCAAPVKCPPPKCRMWCETPKRCQGSTYKKLPQLKAGESAIKAFSAAHYKPAESKQMLQPMGSLKEAPSMMQERSEVSQAEEGLQQEVSTGTAMQVPMVTAMYPDSANQDETVTDEPQLEHRMVEMPVM
mmetsp:Transcript_89319/g.163751  ORF Transcript_89319/g.163751 Transcript_89319/m.163751 type:complete len:366 (-) Transcript_89319:49-1146(-)